MSVRINNKDQQRVQTFNFGQDSNDEATVIEQGFASKIENGILDNLGRVKQRAGIEEIATSYTALTTPDVVGLGRFTVLDTIDELIRAVGTYIEKLHDDYSTWDRITTTYSAGTINSTTLLVSGSTPVDLVITSGAATDFVQAQNLFFICNINDNVKVLDSALTCLTFGNTNTEPPKSYGGVYSNNNRLFLYDDDSVYFSDTLSPWLFNRTTNRFPFKKGASGRIVRTTQFKENEIVIYKTDAIGLLDATGATPLTDWSLTTINEHIGCIAGRTVANMGDDQIFLARDGIRLLSRTQFDVVKNGVISGPIDDIIRRINFDQASTSCGYYYAQEQIYVCFVPLDNSTVPNYGLVWNAKAARRNGDMSKAWTVIPEDLWKPACFAEFDMNDGGNTLVYGSNALPKCYKAFHGLNDDGSAIQLLIDGMVHTTDYVREAIWGPAHVVVDSDYTTTLIVQAKTRKNNWVQVASLTIDQGGGVDLPVNLPFDLTLAIEKAMDFVNLKKLGRSESMQLRFIHNTLDKSMTVNEYTIWAKAYGANSRGAY